MLWEHEPQASVSTAFSSSPKLPGVFFFFRSIIRNTEYMFSISFRKHHDEKKKQLVNFDYQNVNSLCSPYHYVNSVCAFLGLFSN